MQLFSLGFFVVVVVIAFVFQLDKLDVFAVIKPTLANVQKVNFWSNQCSVRFLFGNLKKHMFNIINLQLHSDYQLMISNGLKFFSLNNSTTAMNYLGESKQVS